MTTQHTLQLPVGSTVLSRSEQAAIVGGLGPILFVLVVAAALLTGVVVVAACAAAIGGAVYAILN